MGWMWGVRVKKEHRRTGAAGSIAMLLMKWERLEEGELEVSVAQGKSEVPVGV